MTILLTNRGEPFSILTWEKIMTSIITNKHVRLSENYEVSEGCSVPRNVIYEHYLDFCVRNSVQPVNAASFGKVGQHVSLLVKRTLLSECHDVMHLLRTLWDNS